MYRESQFGGIDKTTDGLNFSGVESGNGNGGWVTPYMLFPNNNNRLLIGREDMNIVDFTNNTFGTRTVRNNPLRHDPSGLGENVIQAITMSESNENVVYTSYQFGRAITNPNNPNAIDRCLFRSTNGGVNWTDISPINFTYPNAPINSILVHPNNPN